MSFLVLEIHDFMGEGELQTSSAKVDVVASHAGNAELTPDEKLVLPLSSLVGYTHSG